MADTIIVVCIIAAAVGFLGYRYFYKKSGGCGCGNDSCGERHKRGAKSCGSRK